MSNSHQLFAQSNNEVAAEALFREARKLLEAGQFREACEKLEASQRLDPGAGTLLNLARCREKTGQVATAWATYYEAIRAAKRAGQPEREKVARERIQALEPTLPKLTIVVPAEARADKVQIQRDGVVLPPEVYGVTVPVDPGEHSIEATAAGRKPWATKANLPERGVAIITVPRLELDSPAGVLGGSETGKSPQVSAPRPVANGANNVSKTSTPSAADSSETHSWSAGKTFALALAAVGVGGLALGGFEWTRFEQNKKDAENVCPSSGCYEPQHTAAMAFRKDANTARTIGIVSGAIGGACLVGAVTLWFTSGSKSGGTSRFVVTPIVGARDVGLGLGGAW